MSKRKEFCLFAAFMKDDYDAALTYDEDSGDLISIRCPDCGGNIYYINWLDNTKDDVTVCDLCGSSYCC